jgi:hypothetical protein
MDIRFGPKISVSKMLGLNKINRIYMNPMFGLLFRADALNSDTSGMAIEDSELSMDILLDFGFRFSWEFN